MEEKIVRHILETYGEAWETQDTKLILSIFTKDAKYQEDAFVFAHEGHEGIASYWDSKVCQEQSDIKFNLLSYYIAGDTLIAEWEAWFTSSVKGKIHLLEVAIMEIQDGKIKSLREYWQSRKI